MKDFCVRLAKSPMMAMSLLALVVAPGVWGQVFQLTKEQMVQLTAPNPFDRFPDGRPKVPDELLAKFKDMSAEELLGISSGGGRGYRNQWEPVSGWQVVNPQRRLVGRAVTLQMMPSRADVADGDSAARQAKNLPRIQLNTAIDMLQKDDVFVVDCSGAKFEGLIGDNLSYYIMKKTGTGFVIDGAIRDLVGINPMSELTGYYRAAVPPAYHDLMVTGINIPIRIGGVTVMPGDVVFGDPEGVYFVPPHLVKDLVNEADITHIHDEWTKKKFDEGKYVSAEIYPNPRDPALQKEYQDYLKQKLGAARYEEYTKRRSAAPQGAPAGGRGGRGGGQQ